MVKLCWIRDDGGRVLNWFYDLSDNKVFCVNLKEYERTQVKITPSIAMIGVGPIVSCISILFRGRTIVIDMMLTVFFALSLVLGIVCISIFYDKAQNKQDTFILNNSVGELKSKQYVLYLFKAGKNYRAGIIFFVALCFSFMVCAVQIMHMEQSAIGILIFYIGAFGATVWLKILSPVKLIQIRLHLNKEEQ